MGRILVVDDEPRIVAFVARAMRSEGFAVDTAFDGRGALDHTRQNEYDLVVLDLMLPDQDGGLVLQQLLRSRPDQPVLVLSAVSDTRSKVQCFGLGAADYVTKPFALAELMARVRTRLKRPRKHDGEAKLRVGRLLVDSSRREVEHEGGRVALSSRESLLLGYLMRHAGQTCTRQELLAEVWGYRFDPGTNVVDVYIGRLRAKLQGAEIETIRGVGYSLRAS